MKAPMAQQLQGCSIIHYQQVFPSGTRWWGSNLQGHGCTDRHPTGVAQEVVGAVLAQLEVAEELCWGREGAGAGWS